MDRKYGLYPPVAGPKEVRPGLITAASQAKLDAALVSSVLDANGWAVDHLGSGKRFWRKRFLAVATTATILGLPITSVSALPVGVANLGAVDVWCQVRMASFSSILVAGVDGTEASTTLSIFVSTTDGSATNLHNSSIDVFCQMIER